ncbi:beta-lactamase family protein [Phormidium tenue FACHB-886]|nr:beta-lactamase family protein [Phormidium tenue FACHB-886]
MRRSTSVGGDIEPWGSMGISRRATGRSLVWAKSLYRQKASVKLELKHKKPTHLMNFVCLPVWIKQGTKQLAAILLLSLLVGCRPDAVDEAAETPFSRPQAWSSAQTQGRLQPFPPRLSIRLQRLLNRSVGEDKLPGAVLYIATSDGVWMGAAGQADLKKRTLLKPTDRFRIANLTELFTAVLCLQLAQEGKLELDEPIARYLPKEVSTKLGNTQAITVRHLLNHTSGLADLEPEALKQAVTTTPNRKWTVKTLLDFLPTRPTQRRVGWYNHTATNYLLLQLILEQVTGQPLVRVLHNRITTPLKLNNTFLEQQEPIPNGFVQGYQDWNSDGSRDSVTQPLINTGLGMGNNGIVSTAPDVVRFFQTLFTGDKLLYPNSLDQMMTLAQGSTDSYGLGIVHTQTRWGEAWGQAGAVTGFSSVLLYLPLHDLTLVVWTNDGDRGLDNPYELAEKSLEIILGDSH